MNIIGIIPARMASSRFPGKPLVKIQSVEMVGHVYFRSKMCHSLNDVYVATCDQEIKDYVESIGAISVMTSNTHERASDRTAEAMLTIEKETGKRIDIVVMIQGDEPMLVPEMIESSIEPFRSDPNVNVVNLMAPLKSGEEHDDPNEIKVVVDKNGYALYFSREPIPTRNREGEKVPMCKQVCIIPFRRDFLIYFNELEQTDLEIAESIDMLRLLENGYRVKMVLTDFKTYAVDTPEDRYRVDELMKDDPLLKAYSHC